MVVLQYKEVLGRGAFKKVYPCVLYAMLNSEFILNLAIRCIVNN